MKQADVVRVLSLDLGTSNVEELNKKLKSTEPKYKISGKALGHLGFNGPIKAVTADGVKVYKANKVSLIRYEEIEAFEKPKAKVKEEFKPKSKSASPEQKSGKAEPKVKSVKPKAEVKSKTETQSKKADESDYETRKRQAMAELAQYDELGEDGYHDEFRPKKYKKKKVVGGKSGSKFIPKSK